MASTGASLHGVRFASALAAAWLMAGEAAADNDILAYVGAGGTLVLTNRIVDDVHAQVLARSLQPVAIQSVAPVPSRAARQFGGAVDQAARESGLESALIHAVIATESQYRTHAVSSKGAVGLMQLMPQTAQRFGVTDVFDPLQNIRAGTRYLRHLLDRFGGNLELALAAYNAGEMAVIKHGRRVPPFPETINYVRVVQDRYHSAD